jgi:hypothetical protein
MSARIAIVVAASLLTLASSEASAWVSPRDRSPRLRDHRRQACVAAMRAPQPAAGLHACVVPPRWVTGAESPLPQKRALRPRHAGHEIDAAFATFVRDRPDALLVSGGPFLLSRRVQLALLAARYAVPASYGAREYVEIGGLMSYGANIADAYRQVGVYACSSLVRRKTRTPFGT